LDAVKANRGDFADGALGKALGDSMAPDRIVEAVREHAGERQGILFAPTVEFASLMAERLNEAGFPAALVTGAQHRDERRQALEDFRTGKVQWLCNCMVLTEGTDLPMAEVCLIARPTRSAGLFIQMVGRVLRPWPGKLDALVLDVVGASRRHRLASLAALELSDETERVTRDELDIGDDEPLLLGDLACAADIDPVMYRDGRLVAELVDLFGASHAAWLRTYGGTWFLPAGEDLITILPDPLGGWMVIRAHRQVGHSTGIARGIPDLSYAMAHGEGNVSAVEASLVNRSASWRKQMPSTRQIEVAERFGVVVAEGMRRGDLSDTISVAKASQRLDRYVGRAR
jgi:hypothetical protein